MEEFFVALFFIENLLIVGCGVGWLISRWARARKEAKAANTELTADATQRQLAELSEEMIDMKEMMADLLLEMSRERRADAKPERLPRDASDRP